MIFILFNTNDLKNILKLSTILVCIHQKRSYICNRLEQQSVLIQASGRYSSGQRGQTVNLLCKLRRFESCSPHEKGKEVKRQLSQAFF
jgi:hypothetical protein